MFRNIIMTIAFLFSFPVLAFDIPEYNGSRVVDTAKALSVNEVVSLNKHILDIEKQYLSEGVQIAVLTVPSVPEEGIEEFANQTFHKWGIGSKEKDAGALLVLALDDRKMRLEVGYGLEPYIPDSTAIKITGSMKPYLREKNVAKAIDIALDGISSKLPNSSVENKTVKEKPINNWIFVLYFLGISVIIITFFIVRQALKEDDKEFDNYKKNRYNKSSNSWPYMSNTRPSMTTAEALMAGGFTEEALHNNAKKYNKTPEKKKSSHKSSNDDDSSSSSSSFGGWGSDSSSSSSSSDSSSSFGGGDSGGGGASDSW